MEDALAEAWKAAGRPDLSTAGVLARIREGIPAGADLLPSVDPGAIRRLSPGDAFFLGPLVHPLGLGWPERKVPRGELSSLLATNARWAELRSRDALAFARTPDSNPMGLNLCAYRALGDPEARRRVGASLLRSLPGDGSVRLALAVDDTSPDAALTSAELDAVEAAAASPGFAWPYRAAFRDVLTAARKVDPAHAELLARVAFAYCLPPSLSPVTLARRAETTKDPALRARAGRAADAVGQRLAASGSMLDRMMGFVLRGSAAASLGDPGRDAMLTEAEVWRQRLGAAGESAAIQFWPLPSIWRQWDPEGDVRLLERLAE
jgi:hypothetical protein